MASILPDRLAWYIAGPALGLLVVGMFMLTNRPLGANGAYMQTVKAAQGRADAITWRVWYLVGILFGGFAAVSLGSGFELRAAYDPMVDLWHLAPAGAVVLLGGVLMGYGARMSGGCTSGHGICGTAEGSPASWAATATFMASAVAVTGVLSVATGGKL